jgi:DNA-binding NarL/FixJ family response regulator
LLFNGKTIEEISELADPGTRTVQAIIETLMRKTGTENNADLIIFAIKNNLIN